MIIPGGAEATVNIQTLFDLVGLMGLFSDMG
jgi:hypothetical protein